MHFDELLSNYVGEMGRYQWTLTIMLGIALAVPLSWYTLGNLERFWKVFTKISRSLLNNQSTCRPAYTFQLTVCRRGVPSCCS